MYGEFWEGCWVEIVKEVKMVKKVKELKKLKNLKRPKLPKMRVCVIPLLSRMAHPNPLKISPPVTKHSENAQIVSIQYIHRSAPPAEKQKAR